jgi:hypothetical protein
MIESILKPLPKAKSNVLLDGVRVVDSNEKLESFFVWVNVVVESFFIS